MQHVKVTCFEHCRISPHCLVLAAMQEDSVMLELQCQVPPDSGPELKWTFHLGLLTNRRTCLTSSSARDLQPILFAKKFSLVFRLLLLCRA